MKLCALLYLLPLAALANELPGPVVPAGVGVNIHFVQGHERDLDLIAAAGFKFVRMDFAWNATEQKKGAYDWAAYDELTRNLKKRGLSALYILDYSNAAYEEQVDSHNALKTDVPQRDTASPQHPESIAAYARWAAAAAKHFDGKHIVWENWNEPNGFFWKPKPDAKQYSALALAAAQAIRKAEPNATVIGPALATFEPPFMETFLKSGVLKYLDAVSVHPYRDAKHGPETAAPDYENLCAQINAFAPEARKLPILCGEWGYSSKAGSISPETQAVYLVRQQLFNLLSGVPLSIWYDWQDDGTDPNEVEHHFGTVANDLKPKPAYGAVKIMTQELTGYHFEKRMEAGTANGGTNDFFLLFANKAGERKVAAWTTDAPHAMRVRLAIKDLDPPGGINGFGKNFGPRTEHRWLVLDLDEMPKFLTVIGPY